MWSLVFNKVNFDIIEISNDLLYILGYTIEESKELTLLSLLNDEMKRIHEKIVKPDNNIDYSKKIENLKSMRTLNMLPLRCKNNTYHMFGFDGVTRNDNDNFVFSFKPISSVDNIQIPKYFHNYINGIPKNIFLEQYTNTYIVCFDIMNSTDLCNRIGSFRIAKIYNNLYQIVHNSLYEISYPYIRIHETCGDSIMLIANTSFLPKIQKITELILNTCETIILQVNETKDFKIRCGIARGDVSGGIIDGTSFRIFGSCVHMASRLESVCLGNHMSCQKEIIDESIDYPYIKKFKLNLKSKLLKGFGETLYYDVSL